MCMQHPADALRIPYMLDGGYGLTRPPTTGRTDSLTAALALLEDKLHLINAANTVPRVDINRIRADVEREMAAKTEADVAARLRSVSVSLSLSRRAVSEFVCRWVCVCGCVCVDVCLRACA